MQLGVSIGLRCSISQALSAGEIHVAEADAAQTSTDERTSWTVTVLQEQVPWTMWLLGMTALLHHESGGRSYRAYQIVVDLLVCVISPLFFIITLSSKSSSDEDKWFVGGWNYWAYVSQVMYARNMSFDMVAWHSDNGFDQHGNQHNLAILL